MNCSLTFVIETGFAIERYCSERKADSPLAKFCYESLYILRRKENGRFKAHF